MQCLVERADGSRKPITNDQYNVLRHNKDVYHVVNTPTVKVIAHGKYKPKKPTRPPKFGGQRNPYEQLGARNNAREVNATHW